MGKHKKATHETSKVPGPGNYNSIQMNISGKYPVSTFKNATTIIFGVSKEQRFNYKRNIRKLTF